MVWRLLTSRIEGKRNLGSHEDQRLPVRPIVLQKFREKHHRRNADATADQQCAWSLRGSVRSRNRSARCEADPLRLAACCKHAQSAADDLEQDLNPAGFRVRTHDRQRPAHRNRVRRTATCIKLPGTAAAAQSGDSEANDELVAGPSLNVENLCVLDERCAAIALVCPAAVVSYRCSLTG